MQVECWYPLGHADDRLLNDGTLSAIAEAHGKSVAQIILRWHMLEGLCAVPGSTNPDHIRENISIFDFELTDDEMSQIRAMDKGEAAATSTWTTSRWTCSSRIPSIEPMRMTGAPDMRLALLSWTIVRLIRFIINPGQDTPHQTNRFRAGRGEKIQDPGNEKLSFMPLGSAPATRNQMSGRVSIGTRRSMVLPLGA